MFDFYGIFDSIKQFFIRLNVSMVWNVKARREFYTLMADFIGDGVGVRETTEEIHQRFVAKKDPRKHITQRILDDQRGVHDKKVRGLGESLMHWSPALEAMVIDAGEKSAGEVEGLRMASELAEIQSKIKFAVISKLTYPAVLLVILAIFLILIGQFLIPIFEDLSPRSQWPAAPLMLGKFTDNIEVIILALFSVVIGILLFFSFSKGRLVGAVRDGLDKYAPPWTIYRRMSGAILMSIFALLTRAGIPFSQTLTHLDAISTDWVRDHLTRMRAKMRRGASSGEAISGELFDEDIRWKIEVYARRSNFGVALESLSKEVQEKTVERISRGADIVRILVLVLMACMFGWVYASFLALAFSARSTGMMGM